MESAGKTSGPVYRRNGTARVYREEIDNPETCALLIKRIFENSTSVYYHNAHLSICPDHGYLKGEHFTRPECGSDAEV